MERRQGEYMRRCAAVFVSHERDRERVTRLAPRTPVFFLRRGIDLSRFHPARRDRAALGERWGVPPARALLLFVGRIDPVKGALLAARLTRALADSGVDVHLLMVGDGVQREEVRALLGDRGSLAGNLPHGELGWIYASCDLLLFPSEAEVWPNVVVEAQASGLPVVACLSGAAHVMTGSGKDGVLLEGRDPQLWERTVAELLARPHALRRMAEAARRSAEARAASWGQVLEEDVLPVWREVAGRGSGSP
jgi:glycosyltransferase involved in cell wall biosynthesis